MPPNLSPEIVLVKSSFAVLPMPEKTSPSNKKFKPTQINTFSSVNSTRMQLYLHLAVQIEPVKFGDLTKKMINMSLGLSSRGTEVGSGTATSLVILYIALL